MGCCNLMIGLSTCPMCFARHWPRSADPSGLRKGWQCACSRCVGLTSMDALTPCGGLEEGQTAFLLEIFGMRICSLVLPSPPSLKGLISMM